MKILEVCTVDFSLTGIPVHIRNYYNELKKNNKIDIVAKSFDKKILKTMPLENETVLYELPRTKNPILYISKLRKIVAKNNYDVVHIHGNSSTMALELLTCRSSSALTIVHTHNTEYKAKVLNVLLKPYLMHHADLYFAASSEAGKKLYNRKKFVVIKNGIDVSNFKFNLEERLYIRKRLNITDDKIILGHVGTFNEQKNQDFLLKLSKKLNPKKYHFVLIGDGEREKFISKIANKEMFTVLKTTDEIGKFYSSFDMFLFPSNWEGLGMAAVEAQYATLQTLVSDRIPKTVKISNNIKFLPLEVNRWVKEIENYSKEDLLKSRKNNFISAEYDIKNCAKKLMNLYIKEYNAKNQKSI